MAAVKCPKCHQITTTNKPLCQWCGYAPTMLERRSKVIAWVALVAIVVLAGVLIKTLSVNPPDNTKPYQNASYMLMEQGKVKNRLKDPESAQFKNVFVSTSSLVCGEVNAKNSLGGYTGFQRFVSGGEIQVVETDMAAGEMDRAWSKLCAR